MAAHELHCGVTAAIQVLATRWKSVRGSHAVAILTICNGVRIFLHLFLQVNHSLETLVAI